MDLDPLELSREDAASPEPSTTRLNPFDDEEISLSSRKRQRTADVGPRNPSIDEASGAELPPVQPVEEQLATDRKMSDADSQSLLPHTPKDARPDIHAMEPTSSRVTINLRTDRGQDHPSSSLSSSPTPANMASDEPEKDVARISIESGSDTLHTANTTVETPSSSSPSISASPQIEVISLVENDSDYEPSSPAVAIIDDDEDEDHMFAVANPLENFPFRENGESLAAAARKIARWMEFDDVEDETVFLRLRNWIRAYVAFSHKHESSCHNIHFRNRDFWLAVPEVIWALNRRRNFFGQFLHKSHSRQSVSEFFYEFAGLAARMVVMDMNTVTIAAEADHGEPPKLACNLFLHTLLSLLRKDDSNHIGRNLEAHYRWNWEDEIQMLVDGFATHGGNIQNLTILVKGIMKLVPRFPHLIDLLADPCRMAASVISSMTALVGGSQSASTATYLEVAHETIEDGFRFATIFQEGLVPIIEKHATRLNQESAIGLVNALEILMAAGFANNVLEADNIAAAFRLQHPELPAKFTCTVIVSEWRFGTFERFIRSGQMQLRVAGVANLCSDLLNMFTASKKEDPATHPMLQHFAKMILKVGLIDYIVGVGSHPEIISESGNIIGFLIATKTYGNLQTDIIWQTVTSSQDPRVVEAIIRMLMSILNLYDYVGLEYLSIMVNQLAIEAFTTPVREFCDRLVTCITSRVSLEQLPCLTSPPYDLFVRLIRESSVQSIDVSTRHKEVQHFAIKLLKELLKFGPEAEIRKNIYLRCLEDVAQKSAAAQGSICALSLLLRQDMVTDLHDLTHNHGLTRLLIEDMDATSPKELTATDMTTQNSTLSPARRDLLVAIIQYEPSSISYDLGERLWRLLVGVDGGNHADRQISWGILNGAALKSRFKNEFLQTCFKKHLRTLDSRYLTTGALEFIREAVYSWARDDQSDSTDDGHNFSFEGIEQLWRIILTTPRDTIETPAISLLVELYIETPNVMSMPRALAHNEHMALVNRCLSQLSSAASTLQRSCEETRTQNEESMVIALPDEIVFQEELKFTRSLAILREFLRQYHLKSHFVSPRPAASVTRASPENEGEPINVKYQSFDGDKSSEVKVLTTGRLTSIASLFSKFEKILGFECFKVYHCGKLLDLDDIDASISLDAANFGTGLVLVQRREISTAILGGSKASSSALELEILKRFDELWSYLGMSERVAKEMYAFLVKFPVYEKLLSAFDSYTTPINEIFPVGQPFKCLYAVYALREQLGVRFQAGSVSQPFLARAMSLLVAAITNREVLDGCPSEELKTFLALHLVESLIQNLRDPVPLEARETLLSDVLMDRLLQLLCEARDYPPVSNSLQLISRCFEAILHLSSCSPSLWAHFITGEETPLLLRKLLIEDEREAVRITIAKQITTKCGFVTSLSTVSAIDFITGFWPIVVGLVSDTAAFPHNCVEILALTLNIFRRLAEISLDGLDLVAYLKQWSGLLVEHDSTEELGILSNVDLLAQGLAKLLFWCVSFAKASNQTLSTNNMVLELFVKHLFPIVTDGEIMATWPILNPITRKLLTDTIFWLVKDDAHQYESLINRLGHLVPYDRGDDIPYIYDLSYGFDRSKAIRSTTGYVGLKNLSNTCYLNSLFTQLYMNVPFRKFMLNVHVAGGSTGQKLLGETQKLFGFMQNSLRRFVDPANLASSIRTYDETNIDVTIQMDVDEFYNLLFDRWESQIVNSEAKKKFRSFFGGQLVQQVKSKECQHISERLEPFSAIQCDIKGKDSLQESLQAYVDGEVMEGDNKYKCSTCDRHVDAVKRACLKDIPDNLIFHLKRFDFNLRTLQRSKINDYFAFPHKIDMRPYKVESLMSSSENVAEDYFELTGILVHSGTAESGHYYSYIRERPSRSDLPTWVEFNDDNVSSFDPDSIGSSCFGGPDYRNGTESGTYQYDKSWSAYMLFYERSSVIACQQAELLVSRSTSPLKLAVPESLNNFIAEENEVILQRYCLYDEGHANFIVRLLGNLKNFKRGDCTPDHQLEKHTLETVMNHIDQVLSRARDIPHFKDSMVGLRGVIQSCSECARDCLDWFIRHPDGFKNLLIRNPEPVVRDETQRFIILALSKMKSDNTISYGIFDDADELGSEPEYISTDVFKDMLGLIIRYWEVFSSNSRAWPEYFGLLNGMARLGPEEAFIILGAGFLRRTLEILTADMETSSQQYVRMLTILAKKPASKPVSYESIIALVDTLLQMCDLGRESSDSRLSGYDETRPLTMKEKDLLTLCWDRNGGLVLCEKLLSLNQNERSTHSILRMVMDWRSDCARWIQQAICAGIHRSATTLSAAPFLKAGIMFIMHGKGRNDVRNVVHHVAHVTRNIDNTEGLEFLQFFKDLFAIDELRADLDMESFWIFCVEQSVKAAPGLLTYYSSSIRQETEEFLQETILKNEPDVGHREILGRAARALGRDCLLYLDEEHVSRRMQASRANITSIVAIIELCKAYHEDGNDQDLDDDDFYRLYHTVLPALRRLVVDELEDDGSEWDASDNDFSSSELMENVAEIGDIAVAEMNEMELQQEAPQ